MVRSTPARVAGWLMIVWLVPAGTADAQVSTATIQGTVTDCDGRAARGHRDGTRDPERVHGRGDHRRGRDLHAGGAEAGTVRDHGGRLSVQAGSQDRRGPGRTDGQPQLPDHAGSRVHRGGDGRRQHAAARHAQVRGHDQRDAGADAAPAAEQPQLPQLRGARTRSPRLGQRVPQGVLSRRAALAERQRLHRRRQLQERRHRRRRRRPGLEPRATRSRRTRCRSSRS